MCDLEICLTSGAISTVYEHDELRIMMGRIDGRPFSALLIDTRSNKHLHLPWPAVGPLIGGRW